MSPDAKLHNKLCKQFRIRKSKSDWIGDGMTGHGTKAWYERIELAKQIRKIRRRLMKTGELYTMLGWELN